MSKPLSGRIERLEAGNAQPPELWGVVTDAEGQPLAIVKAGELAGLAVDADPLALLFLYYGPTVDAGELVTALPLACWLALAAGAMATA
jgi:hypothetical protein